MNGGEMKENKRQVVNTFIDVLLSELDKSQISALDLIKALSTIGRGISVNNTSSSVILLPRTRGNKHQLYYSIKSGRKGPFYKKRAKIKK